MRNQYLDDKYVKGFVNFLADVINGNVPIDLTVGFSINKLPRDFTNRFSGGTVEGTGAAATYTLQVHTLEDFFKMYWWNRDYFEGNAKILDDVKIKIQSAIELESSPNGHAATFMAVDKLMEWAFGEGRSPYTNNMKWAKDLGTNLVSTLKLGRESLSGDCPNFEVFIRNGKNFVPKMNAGWTKYYALALPEYIIYDGRVGGALGYLVRQYLQSLPESVRPSLVPDKLAFRWHGGQGNNMRDPSFNGYNFSQLGHVHNGPREWAKVNVYANWILAAARQMAQASWTSGPDGLRKLEAALFMLGYDFSRVVL